MGENCCSQVQHLVESLKPEHRGAVIAEDSCLWFWNLSFFSQHDNNKKIISCSILSLNICWFSLSDCWSNKTSNVNKSTWAKSNDKSRKKKRATYFAALRLECPHTLFKCPHSLGHVETRVIWTVFHVTFTGISSWKLPIKCVKQLVSKSQVSAGLVK